MLEFENDKKPKEGRQFSMYLTSNSRESIDVIAKKHNTSRSNVINKLLKGMLDKGYSVSKNEENKKDQVSIYLRADIEKVLTPLAVEFEKDLAYVIREVIKDGLELYEKKHKSKFRTSTK